VVVESLSLSLSTTLVALAKVGRDRFSSPTTSAMVVFFYFVPSAAKAAVADRRIVVVPYEPLGKPISSRY
jgi:hypothetical protein